MTDFRFSGMTEVMKPHAPGRAAPHPTSRLHKVKRAPETHWTSEPSLPHGQDARSLLPPLLRLTPMIDKYPLMALFDPPHYTQSLVGAPRSIAVIGSTGLVNPT